MAVEAIDEHGEANIMWQLLKAPSEQLWFQGQFHIPNVGEKEYRVTLILFEKNAKLKQSGFDVVTNLYSFYRKSMKLLIKATVS